MSHLPPACGILCTDKPFGWTSNEAVVRARRVFSGPVGHTGTLDPAATGLLVLAVGRATRLIPFLNTARKRYRVTVCLGTATDTLDCEGRAVESKPVPPLDEDKVRGVLSRFEGEIEQVPPMFSALHYRGQRLYQLARRGLQVPRAARRVKVVGINLLSLTGDRLELDVVCGPGTYIRSLASDIAGQLGTVGHLLSLRRLESDGFSLEQAVAIGGSSDDEMRRALLPLESVLDRFIRLELPESFIRRLLEGNALSLSPEDLPHHLAGLPDRLCWLPADGALLLLRAQASGDGNLLLRPVKIIRPQ